MFTTGPPLHPGTALSVVRSIFASASLARDLALADPGHDALKFAAAGLERGNLRSGRRQRCRQSQRLPHFLGIGSQHGEIPWRRQR